MYDPQGSVQQRHTDGSYTGGYAAYDRSTFEGYGALRQANKGSTGASVGQHDPVGFGGQFGYYTDTETGLLCLTHRYYDPGTGKFINRDPIGYQGGANLYAFCAGNPVNSSDPSGFDQQEAAAAIKRLRPEIISVAQAHHIQPDLLAGAVWVEVDAGGVHGWNRTNRDISIIKYEMTGKASLGISQVTKVAPPPMDHSMVDSWTGYQMTLNERWLDATQYDANDYFVLSDSAQLLENLAKRPNRYPKRTNQLTPGEMAIILTEYNKGPTHSPANKAVPSVYGRRFLKAFPTVDKIIGGK